MKNIQKVTALVLGCAMLIASLAGCSSSLSTSEIEDAYQTALQNSLSANLFYWKETDNRGKVQLYKQVNVLSDMDDRYEPVVDANGDYPTLHIQVIEKEGGTETFQSICGISSGTGKSDEQKSYLFQTVTNADKSKIQTKTPMTAKEYYQSEAFRPYSVAQKLRWLDGMTVQDMDFSQKGCEITKKGNVVQLQFVLKEDFFNRYEAAHGEPSIFVGAKRIMIEIAYEKISQIVIYVDEQMSGSSLTSETEAYKFQIVYTGPKFSIPVYNEVQSSTGEPVWKDA